MAFVTEQRVSGPFLGVRQALEGSGVYWLGSLLGPLLLGFGKGAQKHGIRKVLGVPQGSIQLPERRRLVLSWESWLGKDVCSWEYAARLQIVGTWMKDDLCWSSFLLWIWGWRTEIFQLSGFECNKSLAMSKAPLGFHNVRGQSLAPSAAHTALSLEFRYYAESALRKHSNLIPASMDIPCQRRASDTIMPQSCDTWLQCDRR